MKMKILSIIVIIFLLLLTNFSSITANTYKKYSNENIKILEDIRQDPDLFNLIYDQNKNNTIYAGASAKKITPNLNQIENIFLAGFDRNRKATGIHDDLWSRCCCFSINNTTIAIVSVDLIGIMYSEYKKILDKILDDVSIDQIVLTSTHNHEGPDVIGLWGSGLSTGINWEWYNQAIESISYSIVEAYHLMIPAGLKFGHAEALNFSRDSREPKCTDDQVETIQFVNRNNTPIVTMVFYGSHPEILWDDNTLITSDYPHYIYKYIEESVGGTAVFITGAIGGLITPHVNNHTYIAAQIFGEAIAELALSSIKNESIIWETEVRVEFKELFIPLTNPIFRLASILGMLNRPLYHLRKDLLTCLGVIEIGDNGNIAQIVTVPGEDFPENWLELKEKLHAKHRILIGLGMDELGYIVSYENFDWKEYEESMSASKFLDPIIHNTLENMLNLTQ